MRYINSRFILKLWPFLLAMLTFLTVEIAVRNPLIIERYYAKGLYPFIASAFSFLSSAFPFSLWDIFWLVAVLLLAIALILVITRRLKLSVFLLRLFQALAIVYSFFYLVWGYNYFRPKIENRIGWEMSLPDEPFFVKYSIKSSLIPTKITPPYCLPILLRSTLRSNNRIRVMQ